jgi:hypothetical protein
VNRKHVDYGLLLCAVVSVPTASSLVAVPGEQLTPTLNPGALPSPPQGIHPSRLSTHQHSPYAASYRRRPPAAITYYLLAKACHSPDKVQSSDDGVVRNGSRRESLETERDEIRREDGTVDICVLRKCTVTSLTCMLDVKSYELTTLPPPYFKGPALRKQVP